MDTPQTPVAATRLLRQIKAFASGTREVLWKTVVDVASETGKTLIKD